jgi:hypothetical protein
MPSIADVWARIEAHAGEVFHQKRGASFNCTVYGGCVHPVCTNRPDLPRQLCRCPPVGTHGRHGSSPAPAGAVLHLGDPARPPHPTSRLVDPSRTSRFDVAASDQ